MTQEQHVASSPGNWLAGYRRKQFSQNGEEGVIEKIFSMLPPANKWCVEFGAWDGVFGSNTRFLALQGWSGVFIESDKNKFAELKKTYACNNNVVCINR